MPTLLKKKPEKPAPAAPPTMADDPTVCDLRQRLAARKAEKAELEQRIATERNRPKPSDVDAVLAGGLAALEDISIIERLVEQSRVLDSAIKRIEREVRIAEDAATAAVVDAAMGEFYAVVGDFFDHLESAQADLREIEQTENSLHERGFHRARLPRVHGMGHIDNHFTTRLLAFIERLDIAEIRKANLPGRTLPWANQPEGNRPQVGMMGPSVPQPEEPRAGFRWNWR